MTSKVDEGIRFICKEVGAAITNFRKIEWTDVKIKKVFMSTVSVLSLIGARAAAGGTLFPTTLSAFVKASPLLAISGIFIWSATRLIDYENPNVLSELSMSGPSTPLKNFVAKHGWDNLFTYSLLPPHILETSYETAIRRMSFEEILLFHKEATEALLNSQNPRYCSINPPSASIGKFFEETKNLTTQEILEKYPRDLLYAALPENLREILKEKEALCECTTSRRREMLYPWEAQIQTRGQELETLYQTLAKESMVQKTS